VFLRHNELFIYILNNNKKINCISIVEKCRKYIAQICPHFFRLPNSLTNKNIGDELSPPDPRLLHHWNKQLASVLILLDSKQQNGAVILLTETTQRHPPFDVARQGSPNFLASEPH